MQVLHGSNIQLELGMWVLQITSFSCSFGFQSKYGYIFYYAVPRQTWKKATIMRCFSSHDQPHKDSILLDAYGIVVSQISTKIPCRICSTGLPHESLLNMSSYWNWTNFPHISLMEFCRLFCDTLAISRTNDFRVCLTNVIISSFLCISFLAAHISAKTVRLWYVFETIAPTKCPSGTETPKLVDGKGSGWAPSFEIGILKNYMIHSSATTMWPYLKMCGSFVVNSF